jgi:hypothetical protein
MYQIELVKRIWHFYTSCSTLWQWVWYSTRHAVYCDAVWHLYTTCSKLWQWVWHSTRHAVHCDSEHYILHVMRYTVTVNMTFHMSCGILWRSMTSLHVMRYTVQWVRYSTRHAELCDSEYDILHDMWYTVQWVRHSTRHADTLWQYDILRVIRYTVTVGMIFYTSCGTLWRSIYDISTRHTCFDLHRCRYNSSQLSKFVRCVRSCSYFTEWPWAAHGLRDEEWCLLGCYAMWLL